MSIANPISNEKKEPSKKHVIILFRWWRLTVSFGERAGMEI